MTWRTAAKVGCGWGLAALMLGAAPVERKPLVRKVGQEHAVLLPASMRRALWSYDPTFAVWSETKYEPSLLKTYPFSSRQAPFAVIGDFNGDGALDVVLDGHSKTHDLLLCILSDGSSFRVLELRKTAVRPGERLFLDAFLRLARPGAGAAPEGVEPERPDLGTDAFRIGVGGQPGTLHYFQDGQFRESTTDD